MCVCIRWRFEYGGACTCSPFCGVSSETGVVITDNVSQKCLHQRDLLKCSHFMFSAAAPLHLWLRAAPAAGFAPFAVQLINSFLHFTNTCSRVASSWIDVLLLVRDYWIFTFMKCLRLACGSHLSQVLLQHFGPHPIPSHQHNTEQRASSVLQYSVFWYLEGEEKVCALAWSLISHAEQEWSSYIYFVVKNVILHWNVAITACLHQRMGIWGNKYIFQIMINQHDTL